MKNNHQDILITDLTKDFRLLGSFSKFQKYDKIEIDLGCGNGEFSAKLAEKYSDRLIISSDILLGRLRKTASKIHSRNSENSIIIKVESGALLSYIVPDNSIDRIHLLCPDPWPKKKHRKNRFLSSNICSQIHRVLKKDGIFHFSSDNRNYCLETKKNIKNSHLFSENIDAIQDIIHFKTNFEKRWESKGKKVGHYAWKKI